MGNDVWGWADKQTDKEYALMGLSDGTAFVDVTDPEKPVFLGRLSTETGASAWRDVKVYRDHAYIVADGAGDHGMQVFDLTRLRGLIAASAHSPDALYTGFGPSHNLAINEATGFAYAVSTDTCNGGLHMIDIRTPNNPMFAGCHEAARVHDTQCVVYAGPDSGHRGREICFNSNEDHFEIVDVTGKSAPLTLSTVKYENLGYVHQGWLTEDHRFFLLGDELDEVNFEFSTSTHVIDVSDLDQPDYLYAHFLDTSSTDHNLYVKGNRMFEANYSSGLRVLEFGDLAAKGITEIAFFDTVPDNDQPGATEGAWSVYPWLPSGTLIVSDIRNGLFVLSMPAAQPQPRFAERRVVENAEAGVALGAPVTLVSRPGGALEHTLEGRDAAAFAIDEDSGQLRTRAGGLYDHESQPSYELIVAIRDSSGSETRITVTVEVEDAEEPPGRPAAPSVGEASLDGLRVSWTAPENRGPRIDDYDYRYRPASGAAAWTEVTGTVLSDTAASITGLREMTEYEVQVRASNAEGTGPWSNSATGTTLDSDTDTDFTVPDSALRAALAGALGSTDGEAPIPAEDLAEIRTLNASALGITDLDGLQHAVNLEELYLGRNEIVDISALAGLTKLERLALDGNAIVDVSALADLTRLESLILGYNSIADISPLSNLTGLRRLWINSNPLGEPPGLEPLTEMTGLRNLHLQGIPVSDYSPIAELTGLETLYLGFTRSELDLSPLAGLVNLRSLFVVRGGVTDLSPLQNLTGLRLLDLERNRIADLTPLSGLTRLETLSLLENQVADISPLVANSGLGDGDRIDLRANPLDAASIDTHVPALKDRGADVSFDEILIRVGDQPRIYNDNLYVVPVDADIADPHSFTREKRLEVMNGFYERFEDVFDFVVIVDNLVRGESRVGYQGANFPLNNQTGGLGLSTFADDEREWGSGGKLQSVVHLPAYDDIAQGPMLHELVHRWAAYVFDDVHWGFSSANGQLGGFARENLVELGNGRYTAGNFPPRGWASNTLPYSPIELYLAGFLPREEVPDLLVAEDARWLVEDGQPVVADNGYQVFSATRIRNVSIDDIVARVGERAPAFAEAPKDFRAAVIFLIDEAHSGTRERLDAVSADVSWFGHAGNDVDDTTFNFHEATRNVATIALGGLTQFEK